METFVVNGLAYDIIDANKKEVQVHWPNLQLGKVEYLKSDGSEIREKLPTGVLGIPENVVNPQNGISYTVVAVDGEWTAEGQVLYKEIDKRTKLGYRIVSKDCKATPLPQSGLRRAKITEVRLPKSIRKLGYGAFMGTCLTKIDFPDGVTEIGGFCLADTHIKKIKFPDGIKEIPHDCCCSCHYLREIEIPASVKVIKGCAFSKADKIKKVEIPSSVDLIEKNAFRGCSGLKEAVIYNNDGVITIETDAFPSETKITYKSGMLSKLLGK